MPGLVVQSIMASVSEGDATVTLVTGTMFLMWLGEQVTERGLGNGISMIIFAGIVAGLPSTIADMLQQTSRGQMSALELIGFLLIAVLVTAFVVSAGICAAIQFAILKASLCWVATKGR